MAHRSIQRTLSTGSGFAPLALLAISVSLLLSGGGALSLDRQLTRS